MINVVPLLCSIGRSSELSVAGSHHRAGCVAEAQAGGLRVMQSRPFGVFNALLLSLLILAGAMLASRAKDTTPPIKLEDMKILYHGVVLDGARRAVYVTRDDLPRLYRDLALKALEATPTESAVSKAVMASHMLDGVAAPESMPETDGVNDYVSQVDFISDILIFDNKENPNFPREYEVYLRILRSLAGLKQFGDLPKIEVILRDFLPEYQKRNKVVYEQCTDPSVPIPPDYGSDLWKREHITLKQENSFQLYDVAGFYHPTEIFFYNPGHGGPKGLCALLKRYDIADNVNRLKILKLVGVICEGERNSDNKVRSCFWEWPRNFMTEGDLESEAGISTTWPNSNGSITNNVCTSCHTGNNAFVFYKGTELCYNDMFHPGGSSIASPCYGKRDQWSAPVGDLPHGIEIGIGSANKCTGCHDLGASKKIKYWYCEILKFTTGRVMPPNSYKEGLSWDKPSPGHKFEDSVAELRDFCK
jgi:hypothetical protein